MNATEDGQPVGEAPPINPLSIEPAAWMNAFAAIAEIREIHGPVIFHDGSKSQYCKGCDLTNPCATIQALEKWSL